MSWVANFMYIIWNIKNYSYEHFYFYKNINTLLIIDTY